MMNWNYFNTFGYISVILWIAMPVLWVLHSRMKPRRWLAHVAILFGLVALVFANINSTSHVSRIQPDQTEQIAALNAQKEAKRQAALESRAEDVANIRFAEDGADDFIDRAGMDESDLKYMEKIEADSDPSWRKNKKARSANGGGEDADLEDLIGAEEKNEGVTSGELEQEAEKEPIILSAKEMAMANRLDSLNLKAIRIMILLGLIFVVIDYLKRANVYREAYLPLPVPSAWINQWTPPPVIEERPDAARRSMAGELEWFAKRGDKFLYLTDDPAKAMALPEEMRVFASKYCATELLHAGDLKHKFIFEALWYGRASFLVDSASSSKAILDDFIVFLRERKAAKASVRQTVHIVWDLSSPISDSTLRAFRDLAAPTGFSLFVNQAPIP